MRNAPRQNRDCLTHAWADRKKPSWFCRGRGRRGAAPEFRHHCARPRSSREETGQHPLAPEACAGGNAARSTNSCCLWTRGTSRRGRHRWSTPKDRKRVGMGKGGPCRVDLGGGRGIKKKKMKNKE